MASPGDSWEARSLWGQPNGSSRTTRQRILDGQARIYNYYGTGLSWVEPVTVEAAFDYAKANCKEDNPVIVDAFPYDLLP
jgi:hypothetical protein